MIQRVRSEPLPVYVLSCRKWESWKGRGSVPAFFFEKFVEFSPAAHLKIQISERGKKPHSEKPTSQDLAQDVLIRWSFLPRG